MVVDSTTSAPGLACSRTSSFTRLRPQITTSARPMSLAPRMVSRSGAPGPAPINHTLPKLPSPLREGDRREIRRLPARHLGRLEYLLTLDPESRAVDGVIEPPCLLPDPQHLSHPAPPLVADHRLEAEQSLPEGLLSRRERQEREPLVPLEQHHAAPRGEVLHRRDAWDGSDLDAGQSLTHGPREVGKSRVHVRIPYGREGTGLVPAQGLGHLTGRALPVARAGPLVTGEGEEHALYAAGLQVLPHGRLSPADLAGVS